MKHRHTGLNERACLLMVVMLIGYSASSRIVAEEKAQSAQFKIPYRRMKGTPLALSPDGKTLAAGDDKVIRLWDLESGKLKSVLKGHTWDVDAARFSTDGSILGSVSTSRDSTRLGVFETKLWDVKTGKEQLSRELQLGKNTFVAGMGKDGRTVAILSIGSHQKTLCELQLWDIKTGKHQLTHPVTNDQMKLGLMAFGGGGFSCMIGVDEILVVEHWKEGLESKLWNLKTKKLIATFGKGTNRFPIGLSPDGKTVVIEDADKKIKLWDIKTGNVTTVLNGAGRGGSFPLFSKDGKTLIMGASNVISSWDLETGAEQGALNGHDAGVRDVAFSPDVTRLASAGGQDKTIKLWNVETGKAEATLRGHTGSVFTVVFSPDGRMLASGSADQTVKLWDVQTGKETATLKGHTTDVWDLIFTKDGTTLLTGCTGYDREKKKWFGDCKLWDLKTHKCLGTIPGARRALSPDHQTLASGDGNIIRMWNLRSLKPGALLEGHNDTVHSIAFSPDGRSLASSDNKSIKLWDLQSGKPTDLIPALPRSGRIPELRFSPDGKILAIAHRATLKLWNVPQGKEKATLWDSNRGSIRDLAFTSDGKTLQSAGDSIKRWEVKTGKLLESLNTSGALHFLRLSPDGKMMASTGGIGDGTVLLWRLQQHP